MATATRGAFVEIVESRPRLDGEHILIKPNAVRVNGTDVGLVSRAGVDVSPFDAVTVTLELQVDRLEIKSESDEEIEIPLRYRAQDWLRYRDYKKIAPYVAVAALVAWLASK